MDTTKLGVGQHVHIDGGFGTVEGTIVDVATPCIYVETANGRFRFNSDGKECGLNGRAYTYHSNMMFGPGPWRIKW